MAEVTPLKVANAPSTDTPDLCNQLRTIIERIEKGEFGKVHKAVLVIESHEDGVVALARGREGFSTGDSIGMLEVAKWQIIENMD